MRSRLLTAVLGFAVGATFIGGVAVASSTSSGTAKACRSSSGVLVLASKHGACPRGAKKLTVNAKGVAGPRGPRGIQGVAGPGAKSSVAATTATQATGATISVAGTPLKVIASCAVDSNSIVAIYGTGEFFFHGSALVTGGSGSTTAGVSTVAGTTATPDPNFVTNTDNLVNDETNSSDADTPAAIAIQNTSGPATATDVSAQLIASVGSKTFTLTVFEFLTASACNATAQVTPTS